MSEGRVAIWTAPLRLKQGPHLHIDVDGGRVGLGFVLHDGKQIISAKRRQSDLPHRNREREAIYRACHEAVGMNAAIVTIWSDSQGEVNKLRRRRTRKHQQAPLVIVRWCRRVMIIEADALASERRRVKFHRYLGAPVNLRSRAGR